MRTTPCTGQERRIRRAIAAAGLVCTLVFSAGGGHAAQYGDTADSMWVPARINEALRAKKEDWAVLDVVVPVEELPTRPPIST